MPTHAPTAPPPAEMRIDSGRTQLPLCSCGWRGMCTPDKGTAWHQAVRHEQAEHPGQQQAAKAYAAWKRRQKAPKPRD